jgi:hypothetical protein
VVETTMLVGVVQDALFLVLLIATLLLRAHALSLLGLLGVVQL